MPTAAVDLSQLAPAGRNGGAARFVLDLLEHLAPELPLVLLVRPGREAAVARVRAVGARVAVLGGAGGVPEPRRLRRTLRRLPVPLARLVPDAASLRALGADLLFSPLQSAAFHEPGLPHVAVAYDLQELAHPGNFPAAELRRRAAFRADLLRCDRVVAISEATRADLVARAGLRAERVAVAPPCGPSERRPLADGDLRARLASLGIPPGSYALCPANYWPHKNHERLLRALAAVPVSVEPLRLVLCGALEEGRRSAEALAAELGLSVRVLALGYQEEDAMTALLQGARFVVLPSLFEGFGIPLLEAFRLGVPVAGSDLPAHREVAGDAALLFDPRDEGAIAAALARLAGDAPLRDELAARGRARAVSFPAASVVPAYLGILREAAARGRP